MLGALIVSSRFSMAKQYHVFSAVGACKRLGGLPELEGQASVGGAGLCESA